MPKIKFKTDRHGYRVLVHPDREECVLEATYVEPVKKRDYVLVLDTCNSRVGLTEKQAREFALAILDEVGH